MGCVCERKKESGLKYKCNMLQRPGRSFCLFSLFFSFLHENGYPFLVFLFTRCSECLLRLNQGSTVVHCSLAFFSKGVFGQTRTLMCSDRCTPFRPCWDQVHGNGWVYIFCGMFPRFCQQARISNRGTTTAFLSLPIQYLLYRSINASTSCSASFKFSGFT